MKYIRLRKVITQLLNYNIYLSMINNFPIFRKLQNYKNVKC